MPVAPPPIAARGVLEWWRIGVLESTLSAVLSVVLSPRHSYPFTLIRSLKILPLCPQCVLPARLLSSRTESLMAIILWLCALLNTHTARVVHGPFPFFVLFVVFRAFRVNALAFRLNPRNLWLCAVAVSLDPFRYFFPIRLRNSSRVRSSLRKTPSMELVTAKACCFSTPRMAMQRWKASITTATPSGRSISRRHSAI